MTKFPKRKFPMKLLIQTVFEPAKLSSRPFKYGFLLPIEAALRQTRFCKPETRYINLQIKKLLACTAITSLYSSRQYIVPITIYSVSETKGVKIFRKYLIHDCFPSWEIYLFAPRTILLPTKLT